jgi:hypothetical protein
MSDLVEIYLSDVRKKLGKHMSEQVADIRIAELRSHLHLAIRDLAATGRSGGHAALQAIGNLGSSRVIADDLIYQHRGYRTRSAWLLAAFPISVLLAISVALYFVSWPLPWWPWVGQFSGVVLFPAFAWAVWRSRRWLVGPVVIVTLVLCVLPAFLSYARFVTYRVGAVPTQAPRSNMGIYRDDLHERLSSLKLDLRRSQDTLRSVQNGGHAPSNRDGLFIPEINELVSQSHVTGGLIPASRREGKWTFVTNSPYVDQATADQKWRDEGPVAIESLAAQVAQAEALYNNWRSGPPMDWDLFVFRFGLTFAALGVQAVLLCFVNWLVLALGQVRRRRLALD